MLPKFVAKTLQWRISITHRFSQYVPDPVLDVRISHVDPAAYLKSTKISMCTTLILGQASFPWHSIVAFPASNPRI